MAEKHVLFTLCGLSPQILTENLYCLMVQRRVPIGEVWMISTESGKAFAEERLLDAERGKFYEFCREYDIDAAGIAFDADHIIYTDDFSDVWTLDENEAFANVLSRQLWELTRDEATTLHCSIAGGRKSMSAYLAMVMQFFARPQDKLYHTLIHPAGFENHLEYFYPPTRHFHIRGRGGGIISTADARLEMHEIPFIRLRDKVKEFRQQFYTYSEMVRIAQDWIARPPQFPQLILDLKKHKVAIGDYGSVRLQPFAFALYRFFVQNSINRPVDVAADDYSSYFILGGENNFGPDPIKALEALYGAPLNTIEWPRIQQELSKIKNELKSILPDTDQLDMYAVTKVGPWGASRYGVKLDKSYITLLD